ncbi:isochorismatase EntB [Gottschalkia acidurici 9a]|uniref:Isochorismatase EntB n=1 Tax=Gottschalkia acidurici (strain ATCC 7906 / DSM 604 / BCRC 14475 / CIP 104303 / KCTC 5404 / NCIMB 10678 / 9a) TaxID=1128398 RepID=K0B2T5_GOTA9|nr:isochorismatase family cysteine hydrolase [Gottschalkia acidurici]AFS79799.1 isochorismatase EntB [Gottschalkia acidurici 9a]
MSKNNLHKIKKEECALIIIDMQNDFIREGAPIECPGGRDIIPNIQKAKRWAKENDIPVFYTQEMHRFQKVDYGLELERDEPQHCLEGTEGVEIIEELKPEDDDYVIIKRRYSGYYLTDLEVLMRSFNKKALILTGAATNVCVYATALDAVQRDVKSVVLSDGVAGTSIELHEAFLKNIDYVIGDVVTVDELIKELN